MYEGTKRLRALQPDIAQLVARHRLIPSLPTGWDRLRLWTGVQLEELLAIAEGSGPRTARAALAARLFWEARATAQKFATEPGSVTLFMEGAIKDTEEVTNALHSLAKYLEPKLAEQIKREATNVGAPMRALGAGKTIRRWPFGRQLATTNAERDFYDSIAAIFNKHAHATPFFVLSPREDDAQVWFLVCRALEQAKALVGILNAFAAHLATSSQGS